MSDVLFIAPYVELEVLARQCCAQDSTVQVELAREQKAVELARRAAAGGCNAIVSRGVTSWRIRQAGVELPVVDIAIESYDLLRAYLEARKKGGRIGVLDVEEVLGAVEEFERIIGVPSVKYACREDAADVRDGLDYLKSQGVQVVVGKMTAVGEAQRMGFETVAITSGEGAVARAVREAKRAGSVRRGEKRKAEQFKAILDFTYDGIVSADRQGKITVINRAMEQLTGWKNSEVEGREIDGLIPNSQYAQILRSRTAAIGVFHRIGGREVVANWVPILVDGRMEGVVSTFQPLEGIQKLEHTVRRRLASRGLTAKYGFSDIRGESPILRQAVALAREYAASDATVLLYGKTGTGKEMFAHAIHQASPRRDEPFVAINCAALPASLLESELFGYSEGAFTGALKGGKAGVFETAHGGTLFLDEIGEMDYQLQSRLLRVIEEGEVMRIGSNSILPVDVRLITATNRNLRKLVQEEEFREDLYYRLNVLTLKIPTLHQRGEDAVLLGRLFFEDICRKRGRDAAPFSREAAHLLLEYPFPGNIRELRNAMERLAMMPWQGEICREGLRRALMLEEDGPGGLADRLGALERREILEMVERCGGNKAEAARRLGISRTTLWRKLAESQ